MTTKETYYGRILNGKYSQSLKQRVSGILQNLQAVDALALPVMVYLAAWQTEEETIWYEFTCRRFQKMMGCAPDEIAGAFRNSVLDRRVYRYANIQDDVAKESLNKSELSTSRRKLRRKTDEEGQVEAVYKILLDKGRAFWLKDQAVIETHKKDKISLSLGCMTVVSKEMEATEEKERLVARLQKTLKDFE